MDTALRGYYEEDPGFAQFVERHGYVASKPEVRKEYKLWQIYRFSSNVPFLEPDYP
ncbi:MAG: hypothetical protein LBU32_04810 [Clostridiales bacterium]|jgi:hypothetical protein|nr:hypothetical protein [Clostridiales bacterium]